VPLLARKWDLARLASALAIVTGVLVLVGWGADIVIFKSILPEWGQMKPNTAVGIILIGVSLLLVGRREGPSRRLGYALAGIAGLLGGGTLAQYLFGWNLGIDEILFADKITGRQTSHPGRMSPVGALSLFLLGCSIYLLNRRPAVSQWIAVATAFLSFHALLGYMYRVETFYGIASFTHTALHTAGALMVLSAGVLFLRTGAGPAQFLAADSLGANLFRRLWAAAFTLIVLIGFLRLKGEEMGLFGPHYSTALGVLAILVLLTVLLWRNAWRVEFADRVRRESETALRNREEHLRGIFNAVTVGVARVDFGGKFLYVNDCFCKMLGRSREEILRLHISDVTWPDDPDEQDFLFKDLALGGPPVVVEKRLFRVDGETFWVKINASVLRNSHGEPEGVTAVLYDIDNEKRSEVVIRRRERELAEFFENAPFGLDFLSSDGVIWQVNNTECRILGYSPEELIGHHFSEFHVDKELAADFLQRCLGGQSVRNYEVRLWRKDGSTAHVLIHADLKSEPGQPVRIAKSVQDITAQRIAERERDTRERQQQALATLGNFAASELSLKAVFNFSVSLIAQILQAEFCKILGLLEDRRELLLESGVGWKGGLIGKATVPNDLNSQAGYTLRMGEPIIVEDLRTETRFKAPPLLVEQGVISGISVCIMEGESAYGVLGVHTTRLHSFTREDANFLQAAACLLGSAIHADRERQLRARTGELVERSAELEMQVAARTAELRRTIDFLESFCYSIAHDLRSPLRAMQGFAFALMEDYSDRLNHRGKDYAQRIMNSCLRMDKLLVDLLDYGRLSHISLPQKKVSLSAEVHEALEGLAGQLTVSGAVIEIQEPLPEVIGNSTILLQVLTNLISNAVKFVRKDVTPHVRIYAEPKQGNSVRLNVRDNGIGIEPHLQPKIFRAFEKLHPEDFYPGTGIGLAIVQKGIERMGGRVGVESEVGKGSRFWFELPLARSDWEEIGSSSAARSI
jgi:PAS domain S-box-containing protein